MPAREATPQVWAREATETETERAQLYGGDDLGWLVDVVQEGVTTDSGGRLHPNNCRLAKAALLALRAELARLRNE